MAAGLVSSSSPPMTDQQCQTIEQLAVSIARRTAAQYVTQCGSTAVDMKHWKEIKKRAGVKLYRSRERHHPTAFAPANDLAETPTSVLLCVGTLNGSLEDAMYGAMTPTEQAATTRSEITQDEFVQHRVLHDIRLPTVDEPFQYVGLKWALSGSKLTEFFKAREVVYVEATGFHTVAANHGQERIGYVVNHSVELPDSMIPPCKGALRARYSLCTLFRQTAPDVVEMVATLASYSIGSLSRTSILLGVASTMTCAWMKKMAWMFTTRDPDCDLKSRAAVATVRGSNWFCLQCSQSISKFHTLSSCQICASTVCSRCITTCKLVLADESRGVKHVPKDVCKRCMSTARDVDATQVVIDQYVLDYRDKSRSSTIDCDGDLPSSFASSAVKLRQSPQSEDSQNRIHVRFDEKLSFVARTASESEQLAASIDPIDEIDSNASDDGIELIEPMPVNENPTQMLFRRMHELRVQAEQTAFFMRQQSRTLSASAIDPSVGAPLVSRSKSCIAPTMLGV